jgi:hypothetical protein
MKEHLTSSPVLGYADYTADFILETDASFKGNIDFFRVCCNTFWRNDVPEVFNLWFKEITFLSLELKSMFL